MKTKYSFIIILVFLIFNNCVGPEAPRWERTYRIKNNSNYEAVIRFYEFAENPVNFTDVTLQNGEVFTGNEVRGTNFDALDNPNSIRPSNSYSSLNLIVAYNNEKKMEHSMVDSDGDDITDTFSEPINRHLLRAGNYTNIGNDIFQLVLTQEDFDNATPCDGDCLD